LRLPLTFAILAASAGCAAAQDEPVATFGTTVVISSGLRGLVYHIKRDSDRLPNFAKLKPAGTIYTSSLNIPPQSFKTGFPGVTKRFEWFALAYTGRFWIQKPGLYRFALISDDGSRLEIDGREVIDNDGIHPAMRREAGVELSRGIHEIRVEYFQGPRYEVALILQIAGRGEPFRVFSTDEFKPPADLDDWKSPPPVKKLPQAQ
jgi:PA14 domain